MIEFIKVQMQNDLVAVFPKDWGIADISKDPKECRYAAVCKVYRDDRYPAYVVFSDKPFTGLGKERYWKMREQVIKQNQELIEYDFYEKMDYAAYQNKNDETSLGKYEPWDSMLQFYKFFDMTEDEWSKWQYVTALTNSNTPDGEPAIICTWDDVDACLEGFI